MASDDRDVIPRSSDPRWARWSAPLARWMGKGRTWEEIEVWSKASGTGLSLTRHQIVWLEKDGQIEGVRLGPGQWIWRRVGAMAEDQDAWLAWLDEMRAA